MRDLHAAILLPRIRNLKGLEEMTRLIHKSLKLRGVMYKPDEQKGRMVGELTGWDRSQFERLVSILNLWEEAARVTVYYGKDEDSSLLFIGPNSVFIPNPLRRKATSCSIQGDLETPERWGVHIVGRKPLTMYLSGAIDTTETIVALKALGFEEVTEE